MRRGWRRWKSPTDSSSPNKLGAIRTRVGDRSFPSKKQAARYLALRTLLAAGEIADLECDPRIVLIVNGLKVGVFQPDFRYRIARGIRTGCTVVEDVKGRRDTGDPVYRLFKLKAALFHALFGFEVTEV